MTEDAATPPQRGASTPLGYFANHPLVGLIGTIAGIVGVALTLMVFFISQRNREICYTVSASPTTIVRAGQSSDLRVHFKDKELKSDVSSIQILIWNNGKESIRRDNILSPISLQLVPGSAILEARVKKMTRDLIGVHIDSANASSGSLGLSWNILESADGALLEVIYAGASERVKIDGAIEGKLPVRQVLLGNESKIEKWQLVVGLLLSLPAGLWAARRQHRSKTLPPMSISQARVGVLIAGLMTSMLTFALVTTALFMYLSFTQRPPFPFAF